MDGRDEAGGAERALARLNERPANASVKSATWTCALLMSSSSTSDDGALASIGAGKPYDTMRVCLALLFCQMSPTCCIQPHEAERAESVNAKGSRVAMSSSLSLRSAVNRKASSVF